jgi:hypothetical protein
MDPHINQEDIIVSLKDIVTHLKIATDALVHLDWAATLSAMFDTNLMAVFVYDAL